MSLKLIIESRYQDSRNHKNPCLKVNPCLKTYFKFSLNQSIQFNLYQPVCFDVLCEKLKLRYHMCYGSSSLIQKIYFHNLKNQVSQKYVCFKLARFSSYKVPLELIKITRTFDCIEETVRTKYLLISSRFLINTTQYLC